MTIAHAVIGSAFGDEGKGLMVDYLTRKIGGPDTLVVRFNGGAQAGHTVQLPDGRRHVFHHIGSGTLAGARTHLSRFFVANPFVLDEEWLAMTEFGITPRVSIDPRAMFTTPYDMMINQMAEEARGVARHGSCGLGFNETLKRNEFRADLTVTPNDFLFDKAKDRLPEKIEAIRQHYVPWRLGELGIPMTETWERRLNADALIRHYLDSLQRFVGRVAIKEDTNALMQATDVIFEGAQGLLLDEDHPFFPHVTHSKTGLRNVVELATWAGIKTVEVHYMMRAYMTRHGAGPFPTEDASLTYEDPTNKPNMWQGSLRFGALDLDLIGEALSNDLTSVLDLQLPGHHHDLEVISTIAVTCMDQVGPTVKVRASGADLTIPADDLPSLIRKVTYMPVTHLSYGPTHETIRERVLENGVA